MTILFLIISIALSFAMVRSVYLPAGEFVANRPPRLDSGSDRRTLLLAASRRLLAAVRFVIYFLELGGK